MPYLPRVAVTRTVHGHRVERSAPLFPSYVFVHVEDTRWYPINSTPGVARLIMDGVRPARLPDRVVEEIRAREVAGFVRLPPAPQPRHGDPVRLIRGPFEGQLGLYQGQNGRERTRILLGWLGARSWSTVPSEHLAI